MSELLPPLFQAATASYRVRNVMHACVSSAEKPRAKTLCGRKVHHSSEYEFDRDDERACKACLAVIRVSERYHPGLVIE